MQNVQDKIIGHQDTWHIRIFHSCFQHVKCGCLVENCLTAPLWQQQAAGQTALEEKHRKGQQSYVYSLVLFPSDSLFWSGSFLTSAEGNVFSFSWMGTKPYKTQRFVFQFHNSIFQFIVGFVWGKQKVCFNHKNIFNHATCCMLTSKKKFYLCWGVSKLPRK